MTSTTCQACTAATEGTTLCSRCQHTGERALENIARYHRDLFSLPSLPTGERRAQRVADPTGNAAGAPTDKEPLGEAAAQTKAMLADWARRLVVSRPQLRYPQTDTVAALTSLLSQQMRAIATLGWSGELYRELRKTELSLRRIVAANKGRWYAGVCGAVLDPDADPETADFCTRVLYADPDSASVRCPACGTTWPVSHRRKVLLELARDTETNVATIARAIGTLLDEHRPECNTRAVGSSGCGCSQPSQARLERRIQNWIDRGKIERRGHIDVDGKVRKTYRLGDVLDLLLEERQTPRVDAG